MSKLTDEKIMTTLAPLVLAFDKACREIGVGYILVHDVGSLISLSCAVDENTSEKIQAAVEILDRGPDVKVISE